MSAHTEISEAVTELVARLLEHYDSKVPETGRFDDFRVKTMVYYGAQDLVHPGGLEFSILHMNPGLNPLFDCQRFLSIRVRKSRTGGVASTTCLHGTRDQLRDRLAEQLSDPAFLVDRVVELAHGLPEETNPDLWR